ncbi:MAG: sigma-70 family RNA polymerase sigma factor [Bacteroidales bacterium]|nr:sigma-70 family RNA polymerase sigma factor [Bacteroidales bacterium]
MDDSTLVRRIVDENDHKAFSEIMDKYQRMVMATCRGFVASHSEAQDLTQDVFIELYESLSGFRHESKLSTWIYRIAVNKSLNYLRKKKRESLFVSFGFGTKDRSELSPATHPIAAASAEPGFGLEELEMKAMLKNAMRKLPENQRIAFILSKYQDLSYREIAEVMEVSVASVESLLFRAKTNLRKFLIDSKK